MRFLLPRLAQAFNPETLFTGREKNVDRGTDLDIYTGSGGVDNSSDENALQLGTLNSL